MNSKYKIIPNYSQDYHFIYNWFYAKWEILQRVLLTYERMILHWWLFKIKTLLTRYKGFVEVGSYILDASSQLNSDKDNWPKCIWKLFGNQFGCYKYTSRTTTELMYVT